MVQDALDLRTGRVARQVWLSLVTLLITLAVGLNWDRGWHLTHPFEAFWSPPHVFIYLSSLLTMALVVRLALSPSACAVLGSGLRLPPLPLTVPGPLVIVGAGLGLLGVAGVVLDNAWHTRFGLNETAWSLPHAMLGWSWLVTLLGFVAARLGLRQGRPLPWYTALTLGVLILSFSLAPFFGPMRTGTPEGLQARTAAVQVFPALASQPAVSQALQIEEHWNLTRTNPLYALLGALWVGFSLSLLGGLDRRGWLLLLTVALWSLLLVAGARREVVQLARYAPSVASDPAAWLPPPLVPATIAFVLVRDRCSTPWTWVATGAAWSLAAVTIWPPGQAAMLVVPLAIPGAVVGAAVGHGVFGVLAVPTRRAVGLLVLGLGLAAPSLTGLVDLFLRAHTP